MKAFRLGCIMLSGYVAAMLGAPSALATDGMPPTNSTRQAVNSPSQLEESSAFEIAQAVGECRQTQRRERIYAEADLAADRVRDIPSGTRITLAGPVNQPAPGWIRISSPANGYVLATFLVTCSPSPSDVEGCGVAGERPLLMRQEPSTEAPTISTLLRRQEFQITDTATQTTPRDQDGRVWVQIYRPGTTVPLHATGWVAETGPGGSGRNLERVPCARIGLQGP